MTNASFTKSAKTLANRTEVLLWSDNKIPFSRRSFFATKYIGLFAFLAGIFEWSAMLKIGNTAYPFLQKTELLSLIAGGFLGIFEYGKTYIVWLGIYNIIVRHLLFHQRIHKFSVSVYDKKNRNLWYYILSHNHSHFIFESYLSI